MFLDGREKFVRETLNSLSGTSDIANEDKVLVHFYKLDPCGGIPSVEHNTHSTFHVATVQKGKKRRLSVEEEEQSSVALAKRRSLSALSAEDLDLLNSY